MNTISDGLPGAAIRSAGKRPEEQGRSSAWLLELERGLLDGRGGAPAALPALTSSHIAKASSPVVQAAALAAPAGPTARSAASAATHQRQANAAPPPRAAAAAAAAAWPVAGPGPAGIFTPVGAFISAAGSAPAGAAPGLAAPTELPPAARTAPAPLLPTLRAAGAVDNPGMTFVAARGEPAHAHASGDRTAARSRSSFADGPGTPYAARQLHLFNGAQGVQAWIRDVSLSQAQARLVARSLRQELAASGLRLAGLSLNGKPVAADGKVIAAPPATPTYHGPSTQGEH